jgi:hypothetical protein
MATVMEFAHRSARQTPRQLNAMLLNWVLCPLKFKSAFLPMKVNRRRVVLNLGSSGNPVESSHRI